MSQPYDERTLAERLITTGKMTREELAACLEAQRQAGGPGRKPLTQVVVEQGHVTFNELSTVLNPQPQQTLWCPRCQLQVNAQGAVPGACYACQQCHGELQSVPAPPSHAIHETRPAASASSVDDENVSDEVRRALADPSRRIGRYAVLKELGRGGMGVVYRCYDPQLHRNVAIKMILDTNHADSGHLARFQREARAVAKLQHPGIVALHEVGEDEGHPYLVMDFVEGVSFDILLQRDEPSSRRIAELIRDVALALDHAHDTGIIHRDIKPQNIIVDPKGKPQIMDFGLARDSSARQQLTQTGQIMGTPAYMAPEQADADVKSHGPWTDIYALGAVLYDALTGHPVFKAPNQAALLKQILLNDPQPLSRHAPTISPDLETITLKCLEKDPDRRYPSAAAVAEELQRFIDGKPILARPIGRGEKAARWMRRNRGLSAALAVAVLVAAGAAVLLARQSIQATQEKNQLRLAAEREVSQLKQKTEEEAAQLKREAEREAARREGRARLEAEMGAKEREQRAREEAATQQRERLATQALANLREGVKKVLDRVRSGELLKDQADASIAKADILKYHDPETVLLLTRELDQLSKKLAESHSLSPGQERLLEFLCTSLWNLGMREHAVEALGRYLEAEYSLPKDLKDQLRAIPAGKALCFLGGGLADRLLLEAKEQFGSISVFWLQIQPLYRRTGSDPELEAETARGYTNRGVNRYYKSDLDGALADFNKAIELDPSFSMAWVRRGNTRSTKAEYEEGIADYNRAIEIDPNNFNAYLNRGNARVALKNHPGAIADYSRAIELAPRFAMAWRRRGDARMSMGDLNSALADYQRAIELNPNDPRPWNGLGGVQRAKGALDDAISSYTQALSLDPNFWTAWYNRGFLRATKGDFDGAIVDYSHAIKINSENAVIWNNRSFARYQVGDFAGALDDSNRAIEINPRHAMAWHNRGNARFKQGDLDGAIGDYTRAIEINPRYAMAWFNRGIARYRQRDLDGAIADYTRSIECNPNYAKAWLHRCYARGEAGDVDGALSDQMRALELDPSLKKLWHERAIKSKESAALDESMTDFSRDTDVDPNDAAAWTNRGDVRLAKGDIDGAIEDYTRAIEADPTFAEAWTHRMMAQAKKGDMDAAIANLEGFLEAAPDHPKAPAVRASLEKIREMQAQQGGNQDK